MTLCNACTKTIPTIQIFGLEITQANEMWHYDETGATLTETLCANCFWAILNLNDQIHNYNQTGDPDNYNTDDE